MAANLSTQSAAVRAMIESIARQVARAEIATALLNQRPGGLVPFAVTVVDPVASASEPLCHFDVPFPGFVHAVTFRSTTAGSATLDIQKRRPTQVAADALSIVGATFPSIAGATDALVEPSADWTDWIEEDSTLYPYLTSVSGFSTVTVTIWVRATSSVPS